jgi:hypothetical protein
MIELARPLHRDEQQWLKDAIDWLGEIMERRDGRQAIGVVGGLQACLDSILRENRADVRDIIELAHGVAPASRGGWKPPDGP